MYAHFLLRQKDLDRARKLFGMSIGKCPRVKLFKAYARMEEQLAQFDRCRKIYEKQIEHFSHNS